MKKYLVILLLFVASAARAELPEDSCAQKLDSIIRVVDSLDRSLFLANFKLEKVRFYLNITLKNRSQDKFLKGWIRRALE